ncbi:signal peptidase I [Enhydrobacter aerosaccus]|uniref:Signal peptidase I n=1 Tax=Enhydrobacter aerosaccus TaxID=225324 RepID=A0A1T4R3Y9_9HYPH|nr:signal peptidase I [Enhydrobacter aerosaccus]SKA10565.1 signal peptidase I [Enhydrobacter aerosaccus]
METGSPSLRQRLTGWGKELKPIAISIALVLVVRTVVAEPYTVPTPSMVPTLLVGDELIASKFAYGYSMYSTPIGQLPSFSGRVFDRAPERGDVVVFRLPRDPSTTYVKRVIGLPGDRIQMRRGRLYINDTLVERRAVGPFPDDVGSRSVSATLYIESLPNGREHEIVELSDNDRYDDTAVYVVPARHYFMMGDNRDNSLDSRIGEAAGGVGFVPEENLVARADLLLMSRDPAVGWFDIGKWLHAFRLDRSFGWVN